MECYYGADRRLAQIIGIVRPNGLEGFPRKQRLIVKLFVFSD